MPLSVEELTAAISRANILQSDSQSSSLIDEVREVIDHLVAAATEGEMWDRRLWTTVGAKIVESWTEGEAVEALRDGLLRGVAEQAGPLPAPSPGSRHEAVERRVAARAAPKAAAYVEEDAVRAEFALSAQKLIARPLLWDAKYSSSVSATQITDDVARSVLARLALEPRQGVALEESRLPSSFEGMRAMAQAALEELRAPLHAPFAEKERLIEEEDSRRRVRAQVELLSRANALLARMRDEEKIEQERAAHLLLVQAEEEARRRELARLNLQAQALEESRRLERERDALRAHAETESLRLERMKRALREQERETADREARESLQRLAEAHRVALLRAPSPMPSPQPYGVSHFGAEELVKDWMRHLGVLEARVTPPGTDGGFDVLADRYCAQVKNYSPGVPVSAVDVRSFYGVAVADQLEPWFFTSSKYTVDAAAFADKVQMPRFVYAAAAGTLSALNVAAHSVLTRYYGFAGHGNLVGPKEIQSENRSAGR